MPTHSRVQGHRLLKIRFFECFPSKSFEIYYDTVYVSSYALQFAVLKIIGQHVHSSVLNFDWTFSNHHDCLIYLM